MSTVIHMNMSGAQLTCGASSHIEAVSDICVANAEQNVRKSLTHKIVMSTSDVNDIFECCEVTQAGSKTLQHR